MKHEVITGDCLDVLHAMPDKSVDLVLTSPPYEDARTYGIAFRLKGQPWVDWCVERYLECQRVSKGLVAWVVEGRTKNFRWSATPALLMTDLHRAGVKLRKPPLYYRVGIPGSGGPDWWRNDSEFIVCSSHGILPFSDNTATGHPPKYPTGGAMSNRNVDGKRKNDRGSGYTLPPLANPGNLIEERSELIRCHGGGGHMGSKLASENEAPFPEILADAFIRSFCQPGGIVLDCFAGSGTVAAVAEKTGRNSISIDIRDCDAAGRTLIQKRLQEIGAQCHPAS